MQQTELIKGTLQTIILNLLTERERMYGYEITQTVREMSGGDMVLTEGALYPTLHKMVAEGYLTTETEKIGKRVRKYYKLTPDGSISASRKLEEFVRFVQTMNRILNLETKLS